jgi:4-hydroxybenzoate polyprenyltransferase
VPLLRLLRLPLAPTAAADALAGYALAGGRAIAPALLAALASASLYCGGMVQNDLCDRERDAKLHPDRPLVRDGSLVRRAYAILAALFLSGLALAGLAGALPAAALVLVAASAYNLQLKARFPSDAIALGAARAFNVGVGALAAGAGAGAWPLGHAVAYGLYIATLTGASRAEDMEPRETRRLALLVAGFGFLGAFLLLAIFARGAGAVFVVPALLVFGELALAFRKGTREAAMGFVRVALLAIFLVHAAALWSAGLTGWAVAVLACASASFFLFAALAPRPPTAASAKDVPGSAP